MHKKKKSGNYLMIDINSRWFLQKITNVWWELIMKTNNSFIISRIIATLILILIFILQHNQIIPNYTVFIFLIIFFILDTFIKKHYK